MGRDIRGHAHGDPGGSVHQQIGKARGEDRGLLLGLVVVGNEIDRLLVDIRQHFVGDPRHAHFGVPHGRGGISIHGSEITLAVDQHDTHGKRLRHAYQGIVDRRFAVRMVLTDGVADDTGRLLVGLIPVVPQFAHGVEHAAVDGFQAITHVRQRPTHDYAHGVIQVRLAHLLLDVDVEDFFGELSH